MKILIIGSGGDGPGMNKVVATLFKKLKKDVYGCEEGFKGLYYNNIKPLSAFDPLKYENEAGCVIKTARFPEFQEEKYFKKALKNARGYDYVIVMGGNGSEKGCEELTSHGIKTIFIPGTIDNDVDDSQYSIGFDTAINECVKTIESTMPSMIAMNRSCVFEIMGRHCPDIAIETAKRVKSDICIKERNDINYTKIAKEIKDNLNKGCSTTILLRENIVDINQFADSVNQKLKADILKKQVVGYVQRGGKPTKTELKNAVEFANKAVEGMKKGISSKKILMQNGKVVFVEPEVFKKKR